MFTLELPQAALWPHMIQSLKINSDDYFKSIQYTEQRPMNYLTTPSYKIG